ncbi:hypothetical protein BV25DRAFT_1872741 [Artomyces pyxidatus]|uniref:Uncharacterized protein n=1 Tax=Artomyces pyxidatus TaxID=48021 RepID=A0ACB8SJ77_9AGAM|nr:hypothetical protein BV25DRAFT_1872741 [Artomyces pyxidatus]
MVLQFALGLEHVENNYYHKFMDMFDEAAFAAAGFPPWVRGRFVQIVQHEDTHVRFITAALGADAPLPCTYSFPVNTVTDFVTLSGVFEDGASAAYLGYANILQDDQLITNAGSIVVTETRHATWIDSAVTKGQPWSGSFQTPLALGNVFSLLSEFTVACPDTNPKLPFVAHTPISFTPAAPVPGSDIALAFNTTAAKISADDKLFLAVFSGLNTTFVPLETSSVLSGTAKAKLPVGLQGTAYAVVTNVDSTPIPDTATLTAPAILIFPFDSQANNEQ